MNKGLFYLLLVLSFSIETFAGEAFDLSVQSINSEEINQETGLKMTLNDINIEDTNTKTNVTSSDIRFSDIFGSKYGNTLEIIVWTKMDFGFGDDVLISDIDYIHFESLKNANKFKSIVETKKIKLLFDYARDYEPLLFEISPIPGGGRSSYGFSADDGVYVYIPSKSKWVPLMVTPRFRAQRFSKSFTSEYLNN